MGLGSLRRMMLVGEAASLPYPTYTCIRTPNLDRYLSLPLSAGVQKAPHGTASAAGEDEW